MPSAVKGRLSMVRRVPVGVVGAITPWNSPSVLGMRVVAPALALGNAVVLKPDPQTPVVGGAMFEAVFREAGLPEGLLQVVVGGADVGEALVTDPNIPVVSFTGSTAVGRRVGELAGGMLKKVSLELGGNNAFIVLDDADLDAAAAAGRVLVLPVPGPGLLRGRAPPRPARAWPATTRRARREKAKRLRLGDPYREDVQLGPIVNEKQLAPRRRHRPALDRRRAPRSSRAARTRACSTGRRSSPGSRRTSPAWTDEIFGPVAPIIGRSTPTRRRSPSRTAAPTAWSASIYTRSTRRGLAIADRMRTGMVHINDGTLNDEAIIPFGGMGDPATARRYGGEASLDTFTEWQWVTVRDEPPTFPF